MRKIRVLHFIHSLSGGGAERQLQLLCRGIDKTKFEVAIFCVNDAGFCLENEHVELIVSPYPPSISMNFIKFAYSAIKKFNPDIIQAWLPCSITIPAMVIGGLMRKKVIFSYRNKMYFERPLSFVEFLSALIFSKKIISNHPITDSLPPYKRLYSLKKGAVIHNAVSIPEEISSIARTGDSVKFIFVGRLTQQKNVIALLHALTKIQTKRNWSLDIFGKGELHSEVIALIENYNFKDKIQLHGFSNNIYQEMRASDALLFPSIAEGMPNVLIEALQLGLPALASRIPANIAAVGSEEAVIWIDPLDVNDMAQKISDFLAEKFPIEELKQRGKSVASQYTLENMSKNYQLSYTELLTN